MIRLIPAHAAGQPTRWVLAFARKSKSVWVNRFVPGRFKHVTAMGYVTELDLWLFFDWRLGHLDNYVARGDAAKQLMAHYAEDAELVGVPSIRGRSFAFHVGLWCVPAIKHLVGLRGGALRPDTLFRDCLRQGGQIIPDEAQRAAGLPAAAS